MNGHKARARKTERAKIVEGLRAIGASLGGTAFGAVVKIYHKETNAFGVENKGISNAHYYPHAFSLQS
jgi:hypothetical protein